VIKNAARGKGNTAEGNSWQTEKVRQPKCILGRERKQEGSVDLNCPINYFLDEGGSLDDGPILLN
jgi:hypothetical protein